MSGLRFGFFEKNPELRGAESAPGTGLLGVVVPSQRAPTCLSPISVRVSQSE